MATILFYTPFNVRSRDTESLMLAFKKEGHKVILLNQAPGKSIHDFLNANGIDTYSYLPDPSNRFVYFMKHILFFIRFCRSHNVDIVYSHLEPPNFVSSIAQYFVSAKVYLCRHHGDMFAFNNAKPGLSYKLTYLLAKKIIVVSQATKQYMVRFESINANKIIVMRLAYDFSLYSEVNEKFVQELKDKFSAEITLVIVGQLIPIKRPDVSIKILQNLLKAGVNAKLIIVGSGEMEEVCKQLVYNLGLNDKVLFTGFVSNVLDYMACASIVLHPSVSESSCVVIKEAGLLKKPVMVCKGVGDFDDYIKDGENGYLIRKENFAEEASELIYHNRNEDKMGLSGDLRNDVLRLFSIENVLPAYGKLNK